MAGHYYLRDRGHTEQVGSDGVVEPYLCRGLVGRTGAGEIYALLDRNAQFRTKAFCKCLNLKVVCAGHIRETLPELFDIRTDEWVWHKVDVISYDDEVPHLVILVAGSCGVGYEEIFHTEGFHHPHSNGDVLHRIAFVIMETALHSHHFLASELSEDEVALMSDCSGDREARNVLVWDDNRVFDGFGKLSETAS